MTTQEEQSSVPITEAFNTFKGFPRLPLELRLTIWKLVPHPPRIIKVKAYSDCSSPFEVNRRLEHLVDTGGNTREEAWKLKLSPKGVCDVPGMLHANQEARKIALQEYALTFAFHFRGQPIYFNWERDILRLVDTSSIVALFETQSMPFTFGALAPGQLEQNAAVFSQESREMNLDMTRLIVDANPVPTSALAKIRYMPSLNYLIFRVPEVQNPPQYFNRISLLIWVNVYMNNSAHKAKRMKWKFLTDAQIVSELNSQLASS